VRRVVEARFPGPQITLLSSPVAAPHPARASRTGATRLLVATAFMLLCPQSALADEVFGLWSLSCPKPDTQSCFIWQAVTVYPTGGQTVLGVSVRMDGRTATPEMMLRFSPLSDPAAGVRLKVDDRPDYRLPVRLCDEKVCEARGRLRGPFLQQLRSGKFSQITFVAADGQHTARLSLEGFTPALRALERTQTR